MPFKWPGLPLLLATESGGFQEKELSFISSRGDLYFWLQNYEAEDKDM